MDWHYESTQATLTGDRVLHYSGYLQRGREDMDLATLLEGQNHWVVQHYLHPVSWMEEKELAEGRWEPYSVLVHPITGQRVRCPRYHPNGIVQWAKRNLK